MGKYMRRRRSRGAALGDAEAAPAAVVLGGGVRTRSRSAAVVAGANPAKRRKQATEAATTATGSVEEAGCYLHLRSRRLFMPVAVAARGDLGVEEASTSRQANSSAPSGEAIAAGISRCSSAASSAAARERSGGEAEVSPRNSLLPCFELPLSLLPDICSTAKFASPLVVSWTTGVREPRRGDLRQRLRVRRPCVVRLSVSNLRRISRILLNCALFPIAQ
jgi:hypothetical protein